MTAINYHDLYDAIKIRHSVRSYDGRQLSKTHLETLRELCNEPPKLIPGARIVLVEEPGDRVFPRMLIRGVPAYLVMIGDAARPHMEEAVGYLGEHVILAAAMLGVGTCWMAGTYHLNEVVKKVDLISPTEKVFAVSPLGYPGEAGIVQILMKRVAGSGSRKPLYEMLAADSTPLSQIPYWAKTALEAARLAPSSLNRQPWQFSVSLDRIKISVCEAETTKEGDSRRLDCGIAMCHLELGAMVVGEAGEWKLHDSPDVASYILKKYSQSFYAAKNTQSAI